MRSLVSRHGIRYSFNKQLVDKYKVNLSAIKSFQDLEVELAKVKLQDKNPQLYGMALTSPYHPTDLFDFVNGREFPSVVRFDDASCKVFNQYEDPATVAILKTYREMYTKGIIPRDKADASDVDIMKKGKTLCGIFIDGPGLEAYLTAVYKLPTVSIVADKFPVKSTFSAASNMLAIAASSPHPERAMMFLNLLNTDPYLANLAACGIEDVHYKKISNDRVEWLPKHTDYQIGRAFSGNWYILYLTPGEKDNLWEISRKYNDSGKKSPLFGFSFNVEPVKSEVSAIQNVCAEYNYLYNGEADVIPTLEKFNAKLQASGLEKVQSEMQKQIDAWKKTQK